MLPRYGYMGAWANTVRPYGYTGADCLYGGGEGTPPYGEGKNIRFGEDKMTQQGTIKKLLPNGLAEVEVTRRSACGHDCAKCGGCGGLETQTLYVTARNHAHASVGDRVLLEGETRQVLGFAVLVYLLPLVLFFVGYGVGAGMKLGGGLSALIGGVLFVIGILTAMWYSHKLKLRNEAPFAITERL